MLQYCCTLLDIQFHIYIVNEVHVKCFEIFIIIIKTNNNLFMCAASPSEPVARLRLKIAFKLVNTRSRPLFAGWFCFAFMCTRTNCTTTTTWWSSLTSYSSYTLFLSRKYLLLFFLLPLAAVTFAGEWTKKYQSLKYFFFQIYLARTFFSMHFIIFISFFN